MNKGHKIIILRIIGGLLLIWAILSFFVGYSIGGFEQLLWFSYIGLFLTGIGVFFRKPYLVASELAILLIPAIFWNFDFFYHFFTGNSLFGITDYLFIRSEPILSDIVSYQHIFLIPLALISLWFMKLKRNDFWILSIIQVSVVFIVIRLFTTPVNNIGCVYESCLRISLGSFSVISYGLVWFLMFFTMIGISSIILINLPFLKKVNKC